MQEKQWRNSQLVASSIRNFHARHIVYPISLPRGFSVLPAALNTVSDMVQLEHAF